MLVKFTAEHAVRVSGTDSRIYPAGWSGELDDKIAGAAIRAGKAEDVVMAAPASDAKTADADVDKTAAKPKK